MCTVLRLVVSVTDGLVFSLVSSESDATSLASYSFPVPQPAGEKSAIRIDLLRPFILSVRSTIILDT